MLNSLRNICSLYKFMLQLSHSKPLIKGPTFSARLRIWAIVAISWSFSITHLAEDLAQNRRPIILLGWLLTEINSLSKLFKIWLSMWCCILCYFIVTNNICMFLNIYKRYKENVRYEILWVVRYYMTSWWDVINMKEKEVYPYLLSFL